MRRTAWVVGALLLALLPHQTEAQSSTPTPVAITALAESGQSLVAGSSRARPALTTLKRYASLAITRRQAPQRSPAPARAYDPPPRSGLAPMG